MLVCWAKKPIHHDQFNTTVHLHPLFDMQGQLATRIMLCARTYYVDNAAMCQAADVQAPRTINYQPKVEWAINVYCKGAGIYQLKVIDRVNYFPLRFC